TFGDGATVAGYFTTNVTYGTRPFAITTCNIPGCPAPPAEGLLKLRDLLDRIASETTCETLACPPNAVFTPDRCYVCDPQSGGCTSSVAGCALVCSDSSPCASGLSCSARGICEAVCGP
ncbi:MAG TPA: hypothetical protein VMF89_10130, partial [Polyangiales bacterium]|nr:hypothetical protein [Polyangiales bacterium]